MLCTVADHLAVSYPMNHGGFKNWMAVMFPRFLHGMPMLIRLPTKGTHQVTFTIDTALIMCGVWKCCEDGGRHGDMETWSGSAYPPILG